MSDKPLELEPYVEQLSQILELPLTLESKSKVIENLATLARISQLFTEYPLPDRIEFPSKFEP